MKLSYAFTISLLLGLILTSRASPNVDDCMGEECSELFSDECNRCVDDCTDGWYNKYGIDKEELSSFFRENGFSGLNNEGNKSIIGGPQ